MPLLLVLIVLGAAAPGRVTPGPAVTDANLAERVRRLQTPAEQMALGDYYAAEADAEAGRILFYEELFRAYNDLPGREYEPYRQRARRLLKAARESREQLDILATAHRNRAMTAE
jgi:hypothetical protein